MNKEIIYGNECRRALKRGVDGLSNAVKVTLGAKGRNVIISEFSGINESNPYSPCPIYIPRSTKDGITVAKNISFSDMAMDMGAKLVMEASAKTCEEAGDGPQPLYSRILTPKGWITMGEVKIGDEICGTSGTTQKVIGVFPKGEKEIYNVEFSDGRVVECCKDHLWNVITNNGSKQTKTVSSMINQGICMTKSNGDVYRRFFVPSTIVDFKEDELPIHPYLLGLLLGDGSLSGTGSIELSLGKKKEFVIDSIMLPDGIYLKRIQSKYCEERNYIRIKIQGKDENGNSIEDLLKTIGLFGVKSGNKFIPSKYLYSSMESRKQLLQGLIDTDGHINKKGLFEYSTISEELYSNFLSLCRGLAIPVNTFINNNRGEGSYSNSTVYRVTQLKGYKYGIKINKITPTGEFTKMQCIKVSNPDELYITNDYIPTHNTSSTCVLAQGMIDFGFNELEKGKSPVVINNEIDRTVDKVIDFIRKESKSIGNDFDTIEKVATVSANNDNEIGKLIANAFKSVGKDGIVTLEEGRSIETTTIVDKGYSIMNGWVTPHFINNAKDQCILDDSKVILCDMKIETVGQLDKMLSTLMASSNGVMPNFIIVCDKMEDAPLKYLVINNAKKIIKCCVVQLSNIGYFRTGLLEDIAIATGGNYLSKEKACRIEDITINDIGLSSKVVIDNKSTKFIGGNGDKTKIKDRVKELQKSIEFKTEKIDQDFIKNRIAKFTGGSATISVGGVSSTEIGEKYDRVEDAICAVTAAIEQGVVPGAGSVFIRAARSLEKEFGKDNIVLKSLPLPFEHILSNAGIDCTKDISMDNGEVFNVLTMEKESCDKSSIFDPTKVLISSLKNAASAAKLFMTTECVIIDEK